MAWWDHEELKSPQNRSDRYKKAFPVEYSFNKETKMMTVQEKLALYNSVLDEISQIKVLITKIGMAPASILIHIEVIEALVLKEIKGLEIG